MLIKKFVLAVVLTIIGSGAGLVASGTRAAEDDVEAANRLREEISTEIGEARCRNLVNCRIVGLGMRPCGGPEEYVAYSIWETDREHMSNLVFEYNLLREDLMLDSDAVGTCEQISKPGVDCNHDRCVTVPGVD
ncbi:MAG TPA: hypothetical protein VMW70_15490 [Burkholderiales bacterium]|nr:hypothetical protein [Burkholderiales bacterium]